MFYYYRQTLDQLSSLFTGQPLYDLCSLHKKWLRIYAGKLGLRTIILATDCPTIARGRAPSEHEEVGSNESWVYVFSADIGRIGPQ